MNLFYFNFYIQRFLLLIKCESCDWCFLLLFLLLFLFFWGGFLHYFAVYLKGSFSTQMCHGMVVENHWFKDIFLRLENHYMGHSAFTWKYLWWSALLLLLLSTLQLILLLLLIKILQLTMVIILILFLYILSKQVNKCHYVSGYWERTISWRE